MGDKPTIALILLVFNEIDGLKAIVPAIDQSLFNEIILVDGGSSDGSTEFARKAGLRVIQQRKPGLSEAVLEAVSAATSEYLIEFSPDGNCKADDLPNLVAKIREGYDLVVVSRYLPPAVSYDDTAITHFGNWMFTKMIGMLGSPVVTDALTIYRGFRREIPISPSFKRLLVGPVFEPLVTAWVLGNGRSYAEIPGDEPRRIGGERKMRVIYNGSCIIYMVVRMYLLKLTRRIFMLKPRRLPPSSH
ncbi:glycosyltransferase family 2 protein [Candidatus Nitronereus thalassa]|uniref:Glycosyltransferase family 2 protein n=1 Tax=Candidatus Nitronereus thalassa TaxID=3020898 RepID=A0ABU3K5F8_9BACT|nr:glycosyltransferase family 2 protein [Candidatus Nitronereus thalassa]MDT7041652.1 glycosyltransferase family 2 protein [Candidatus Nitronereus thalassa]